MVLTTPQARRRKANLKAVALEKKSEARSKLLSEQLDEWFNKFDTDGDKHFDRDELAALLTHLNPGAPPSSDVIDMVMKDATGVYTVSLDGKPAGRKSHMYDNSGQRSVMQGRANGTIHRDKLVPVVKKYSAYIREQVRRRGKEAHTRSGGGMMRALACAGATARSRGPALPRRRKLTLFLTSSTRTSRGRSCANAP